MVGWGQQDGREVKEGFLEEAGRGQDERVGIQDRGVTGRDSSLIITISAKV